jgi:hypothetical protein
VTEHSLSAGAPPSFTRFIPRLLQAAFLLWAVLGAQSLLHEWRVLKIAQAARLAGQPLSVSQRISLGATWSDCAQDDNVRWLEACARLHWALSQPDSHGGSQKASLEKARLAAYKLMSSHAGSGETLILWTMTQSGNAAASGVDQNVSSLMRSYQLTPFSRSLGLWRIWYGAHHWDLLTPQARYALLEEASWYGRIGERDAQAVLDALAHTQAFIAVSLRLSNTAAQNVPFPISPE